MFKALIIDQSDDNKISASVQDVAEDRLPQDGEVDIAVEYSTVNYKDGLVLNGLGRLVKTYPHVPGIDFAGAVINSSDDRFKPGDKVNKGDKLLSLEAMKMETTVYAEQEGTLAEVLVSPGTPVEAGELIARYADA